MTILIDLDGLRKLIYEMSRIWETKYVNAFSPALERISERAAFHIFGEANVKRWVYEGKVDFKRKGGCKNSKKEYSYSELMTVKQSETIMSQFVVNNIKSFEEVAAEVKKAKNN